MNVKFHTQIAKATLLGTLVEFLVSMALQISTRVPHFGWMLLANWLTAYVMAWTAVNLRTENHRSHFIYLFALSSTVGTISILIEALIFNITDIRETLMSTFLGLARYGILSYALTHLLREWLHFGPAPDVRSRSFVSWTFRLSMTTLLYVVIYMVAGAILQVNLPAVMEFYKDKLPALEIIFGTQVLRGFVLSLVAVFFLRKSSLGKYGSAAMLGINFSVLGGVAPLIQPNEYMPFDIRIGHGFEVGISNFIYGFLTVMILGLRSSVARQASPK